MGNPGKGAGRDIHGIRGGCMDAGPGGRGAKAAGGCRDLWRGAQSTDFGVRNGPGSFRGCPVFFRDLNGKRQWTEQGEYTGNSIPAVSDSSAVDLLYEISDGFSGYSLMFRKNASYVIRGRAYGANDNTYIDYMYNVWASNPFSFTAAVKDGSDVSASITTKILCR